MCKLLNLQLSNIMIIICSCKQNSVQYLFHVPKLLEISLKKALNHSLVGLVQEFSFKKKGEYLGFYALI